MSDTPHAPRASMKGVSGLIREILDNLEKAPPPSQTLRRMKARSAIRKPRGR